MKVSKHSETVINEHDKEISKEIYTYPETRNYWWSEIKIIV